MGLALKELPVGVQLDDLQAPVALCDDVGVLVGMTDEARNLLRRLRLITGIPARLPGELWAELERVAGGEAVEWRPPEAQRVLGCTRYRAGAYYLVLMKE